MNPLAFGVALIGVISSVFTCFMNCFLLKTFFDSTRKKADMMLFYYRFSLDVFLGILMVLSLTCTILYSFDMEKFSFLQNFVFFFSLPSSNSGAVREILVLAVSIERNMAAYTPIFYHNFRQRIPTLSIFLLAVAFGLVENAVLFGFCDFSLNPSKNCAAFGCMINTCFLGYWSGHKSVAHALCFLFSMTLGVKLFILNNFSKNSSSELSRVNRLALLDACNVCIFDFVPSFISNRWSNTPLFSFQNIGPYGATGKMLGCGIEAFFVWKTLIRKCKLKNSQSEAGRSQIQIQIQKTSQNPQGRISVVEW